jgi:hypothetical protein
MDRRGLYHYISDISVASVSIRGEFKSPPVICFGLDAEAFLLAQVLAIPKFLYALSIYAVLDDRLCKLVLTVVGGL